jgi:hypothetical protein
VLCLTGVKSPCFLVPFFFYIYPIIYKLAREEKGG